MFHVRKGTSIWHVLMHHAIGVVLALGLMGINLAHAVTVKVRPDQARVVAVAGDPAAVVIGNPLFTEVAVLTGRKLLVQGRAPGKTNVIVLDVNGAELARFDVIVTGREEEEVALYKQGKRSTYICAPLCDQTLNSADDMNTFVPLKSRIENRFAIIRSQANNNGN